MRPPRRPGPRGRDSRRLPRHHHPAGRRARCRRPPDPRGDLGRVGLSPAGPLAQGRARPHAADAGDGAAVRRPQRLSGHANLDAGVRHLKTLLDRFALRDAIAAYNAGEAAVRRFGGVPPFRETRAYVERVLSLAGLDVAPARTTARPLRPSGLLTSLIAVGDREARPPGASRAAARRPGTRRPPTDVRRLVYSRPCGRVVIS